MHCGERCLEDCEPRRARELQLLDVHLRDELGRSNEPRLPAAVVVGGELLRVMEEAREAVELTVRRALKLELRHIDPRARLDDHPRAVLPEQQRRLQPLALAHVCGENRLDGGENVADEARLGVQLASQLHLPLPQRGDGGGSERAQCEGYTGQDDPRHQREKRGGAREATVHRDPRVVRNNLHKVVQHLDVVVERQECQARQHDRREEEHHVVECHAVRILVGHSTIRFGRSVMLHVGQQATREPVGHHTHGVRSANAPRCQFSCALPECYGPWPE
mmetsp:Transcript_18401/g.44013  ORF Transcript_18401/g.44013 Transcript_18401/m.44013 type:complete len:277 (+) Transcript_18401:875-1705(+)